MKRLTVALIATGLFGTPALAAQCRDHGRFVKCPTTAAAPAAGGVTRDAHGRCRQAGKFVKCPAH